MRHRTFTYLLFMLFAIFLASCSRDELEEEEVVIPEGMAKLSFNSLSVSADGSMTRAIKDFAKGNTIRVYMYKVPEDGSPTGNDVIITDTPFKEFTLIAEKDSDTSPTYGKMCNVDNNGKFQSYSNEEVIVPQGKYRIIAISPAIKLGIDTEDGGSQLKPALEIGHKGIDLMTTGTGSDYSIVAGDSGIGAGKDPNSRVYNVTLPAFKHVMSRIRFTVKKKEGTDVKIKNLKIHEKGIEVGGLTPNAYYSNFFIGNDALVNMEQQGGDAGINITDFTVIEQEVYKFQANILPHRATDNLGIRMTFHLLVNDETATGGLPARYKAYLFTIDAPKHYERGKSYDYEVLVDVGGIFVNGWKSGEWGTEI